MTGPIIPVPPPRREGKGLTLSAILTLNSDKPFVTYFQRYLLYFSSCEHRYAQIVPRYGLANFVPELCCTYLDMIEYQRRDLHWIIYFDSGNHF